MTLAKLACLVPALLGLVTGCARTRSLEENSEQRCSNGDRAACARACERGVHGKTGCMAAVHDKNPVRRTKMLTRACDAGQAGACVMAADASITLGMSNPRQYQTLLTRACEQRDKAGCEKLGDLQLLDALDSAKAAYDRGCHVEPSRARACSETVTRRIAAVDAARAGCKNDELEACERLLSLTAARNHDLGYEAAEAVCRLRGLTEYYRQTELEYSYKLRKRFASYERCGLFLLARAANTFEQSLGFQRVPLPEPPASGSRRLHADVALTDVRFHFRHTPKAQPEQVTRFKADVEARIRERLDLAARCYERHLGTHPDAQGKLDANFIIDKLGEPLELRASGELTDPKLCACLLSAAIPERFSATDADLGSIVRVEATLELTPQRASAR
ncbi:MAG TPA: hypothetical protein VFU02_07030 [Polyangiaceae bacterium]|nr:hypothetical protein [Polyangiaceae bacterium]